MSFNSMVLKSSSSSSFSQQGFTLIELLITIAIMAILVSIALPNMLENMARQKVKDSTATFVTSLRDAKAESVISDDDITVKYNATSKTLTLSRSDDSKIGSSNVGDSNTVTIENDNSKKIVFTKDKTATKSTIKICNTKGIVSSGTKITVSPTAVVSIKGVECQ